MPSLYIVYLLMKLRKYSVFLNYKKAKKKTKNPDKDLQRNLVAACASLIIYLVGKRARQSAALEASVAKMFKIEHIIGG